MSEEKQEFDWEKVHDLFEKILTEYIASGGDLRNDSIKLLRNFIYRKKKEQVGE